MRARAEADLAECQVIAAAYRAELDAVAHETSHNEPAFAPLAQAYLTLGSAEVSRLEGRSDPTIWSETAAGWQDLVMPHAEAYARFRQAEAVLHRNHSRRAAQDVLRHAHDLARDLGAAALLRDVEELAKRSRLEIGAEGTGEPVAVVDPAWRYGLTPREREVLELLAAGDTNRQIAERLFISEKTASVHVSNILRKLSASSRTEAAGLAYRLNLVVDRSGS